MQKEDWYFVLFVIAVIVSISLNELGYGVITLLLLLPTCLLFFKAFEKEKPSD